MQAELSAHESAGVWRTIAQALKGTHQDFTQISISRAVFLLAIPMVLEMFMESLFALVDVFWVTRLGANAIAAVGLTESMLTLVFSVALGVSFSTTAMVARRIGEKDPLRSPVVGTLRAPKALRLPQCSRFFSESEWRWRWVFRQCCSPIRCCV